MVEKCFESYRAEAIIYKIKHKDGDYYRLELQKVDRILIYVRDTFEELYEIYYERSYEENTDE